MTEARERAWLEQHFRDPQSISKGTIMLAFLASLP